MIAIADQDLRKVSRRRIADKGRAQIVDKKPAHLRQLRSERARQFDGVKALETRFKLVADEQRRAVDLRVERIQRDAQGVADKIVDVLAVEIRLAIVPREQCLGEAVEDRFQRIARWGAPRIAVAPNAVGLLSGDAQLGDDPVELPAAWRAAGNAGR
jgi:hypothetical protein